MDLKSLQTDLNAAEDGVFFPFGEDCEIKIAAWMNKNHRTFLRNIHKKHGRKIEAGAMNDEQANQLLVGQWEHIVKDWNGLEDGGKPLKWSPKVVADLAANPQYESFFDRIKALASEEENYRTENIKDLGNDSPTS
jgi:hypothetical protein